MKNVNFMVNFDMVGRLGCEGNMIYVIGTASSPDWKKIYKAVDHDSFRVNKMKGVGFFSDNLGFYKKSIPVAYFTTGFHYQYHTPEDNAATINYDGLAGISRYAEDFLAIASGRDRIRYNKVSGWNEFGANWHYITEGLDYLLVVGASGAE